MNIRQAVAGDAAGMSDVLREIVAQTGRERRTEPTFVMTNYVNHEHGVRCTVAVDNHGEVIGFQSLIRSWPNNPYDVPAGWGLSALTSVRAPTARA